MNKKVIYTLELNKSSYYCGETILGLVTLKVNKRLKINALKYNINGRTHFGQSKITVVQHLNVTNDLLKATEYANFIERLLGFPKSAALDIGEYYYPFEFVLPVHLPPSFKHDDGKTEYFVCSTLCLDGFKNKFLKLVSLNNVY